MTYTAKPKAGNLVTLGLRVPADLRRSLKIAAATNGLTMEQLTIKILRKSLRGRGTGKAPAAP